CERSREYSVKSLIAMFFGKTKGGGTKPRISGRRPALEGLEDRLAPAIFNVNTFADVVDFTDTRVSLREAIHLANVSQGEDVIQLQAGVYNMTIPNEVANPDPNATGSFEVLGTTTLRGAGPGLTVIDGRHLDRVFGVTGTSAESINVAF